MCRDVLKSVSQDVVKFLDFLFVCTVGRCIYNDHCCFGIAVKFSDNDSFTDTFSFQ